MSWLRPFFPEQASTLAAEVDALYSFLGLVTVFFVTLIGALLLYMGIRYRRRSGRELPAPGEGGMSPRVAWALEAGWSLVPLLLALVIFAWGASLYFKLMRPPADAIEILVVGKRWMWKFQHLEGRREMNELHVPLGRKVRLRMASEDVIHSFYVPAFRIKHDVLPGRYTTVWFQATQTGRFRLYCAEFCGTRHSGMTGWVEVMSPPAYEEWLAGGVAGESVAEAGARLFRDTGCPSCHGDRPGGRGPALQGLYGRTVELETGGRTVADEQYLRESILLPAAKVVKGYPRIMPTYQGVLGEEQVLQVVAYLRSLGGAGAAPAAARDAGPTIDAAAPPADAGVGDAGSPDESSSSGVHSGAAPPEEAR